MEYDEVRTFFHEFGHLMHHILGGQVEWVGVSGISTEADFIEAPSQMLEEWMRSPQVLASFAHNYKTGEPIPVDLVARMNRASAFGRGGHVTLQNGLAAISYDVYKGSPQDTDLDSICLHDLTHYTTFIPFDADVHMYATFGHLAGYSSAYYTYMWDEVIAQDFFQQFDRSNLLAGDAPMRYRRTVLEPGGSMSANDLVKNFPGRPQNMSAFQRWMGEGFASAHGAGSKRRATHAESIACGLAKLNRGMNAQPNNLEPILCAHLLRRVDEKLIDLLRSLEPSEWDLQTRRLESPRPRGPPAGYAPPQTFHGSGFELPRARRHTFVSKRCRAR
jgi:hypothetical protein